MKILITTDLFTTETNGVVTSIKNLVTQLHKNGHEVRILTLSDTFKSYRKKNVYYIRSLPVKVYPNVRMPMFYRHKYINEIVQWKPDVIHSQCEFFSFHFATYISKRTGAPIVHTYHTLYEQYAHYLIPGRHLGHYVVRVFSKKRLKDVSAIIAPTQKVKKALTGYGIKKDICVVPSGINLEQHKRKMEDTERENLRTGLGISENEKVLINLGRMGDEKNLEELLYFFADVVANHQDVKFLLVGDGPAKKHLSHLAKHLGIADKVIFTGMIAPEDVWKYYRLGDIFISASTSETQGLTYVEAAANGLPLVCRSDLCLKEIVFPGQNGYEYTCKKDFLQKIDIFLADDVLRKEAGNKSREVAMRFDREHFGNEVESVYEKTI